MMAVVLNAGSGVADRARQAGDVQGLFRKAGIDAQVREVHDPHQIPAVVRDALAAAAETIVAGGGDGTVSSIASVLAGTRVPLGVLPLGTLNHFAKDLGIPLDPARAVDVIASGHVSCIDVGRVNDRVFVNNCSLGVYPSILEIREHLRRRGSRRWTAFARATLEVLRREGELTIRLEANRTNMVARTPFVFVGNNEYVVEGIKLGARARLDTRRLWAYFAPPVRTRYLPYLLAHALFGAARRRQVLITLSSTELWIDTPSASAVKLACDGELLEMTPPLHCRSWPGALHVLTPAP
jgi:diacylglycerol kinase family enzyme